MASHPSSVLAEAGLVLLLSASVVVPCLAAGESSSIGREGCETSCGGVDIPFPFGMEHDHCWLPGFEISCKQDKPFMVTYNRQTKAKHAIVEVLSISLDQAEAMVLHPISSYCYDAASGKMVPDEWHWSLDRSSYSFSSTANKFTVVGCRALAYIGGKRGSTDKYQTGCVAMCFGGNMSLNPCSGMGCCQTGIPKGLQYYQVWFDERLNTSEMNLGSRCSFAVLMDTSNFTSMSSNNMSSPDSPWAFNSSRGGKAPVVLDWSIGYDNCTTAEANPAGYACRSINSFCSDAASGRGYICNCKQGFEGNPYLPNGCKGQGRRRRKGGDRLRLSSTPSFPPIVIRPRRLPHPSSQNKPPSAGSNNPVAGAPATDPANPSPSSQWRTWS